MRDCKPWALILDMSSCQTRTCQCVAAHCHVLMIEEAYCVVVNLQANGLHMYMRNRNATDK